MSWLMRREGYTYCLISPWIGQVHRWGHRQDISALANRIREQHLSARAERTRLQHPMYARAHRFFTEARFRIRELNVEEFLLTPQGRDHPQARYRSIYVRLITGRPPTGDDFTAVFEAAREYYADGDQDLAVANDRSDNVSVLLNNGNGTFQAAINYGAGDGPISVFASDLDGDNDHDLTVVNRYSDNVSVF